MIQVEENKEKQQFEVELEVFNGPFDLLLNLIEEEKVDIYEVSISKITTSYLNYLHELKLQDLDVTGEFLIMAAALIELKSKLLLPSDGVSDETLLEEAKAERLALLEKLVEYKMFKKLAGSLSEKENLYSKVFDRAKVNDDLITEQAGEKKIIIKNATMQALLKAFDKVWHNLELRTVTRDVDHLAMESFSVKDKMKEIVDRLKTATGSFLFSEMFVDVFHKVEVIATFIAILELVRQRYISVYQSDTFDDIELRKSAEDISKPIDFDDSEYNTVTTLEE